MLKKIQKKYIFIALFLLALVSLPFVLKSLFKKDNSYIVIESVSYPNETFYRTNHELKISFENRVDDKDEDYNEKINAPIAPIDKIGKVVKNHVSIEPSIAGTWTWKNSNTILFKATQKWPAEQKYVVTFNQKLFDKKSLRINDYNLDFVTEPFKATIDNFSFESSQKQNKDYRVYATIRFSHIVDLDSIAKNIHFVDQESRKDIAFKVTTNEKLTKVYLISEPIKIKDKERYIKLYVNKGVKTTLGKANLSEEKVSKVLVPDIYSFMKVESTDYSIITNKDGEPEQIFRVSLTDAIDYDEFTKHTRFQYIPNNESEKMSPSDSDVVFVKNKEKYSKNYFIRTRIPFGGEFKVILKKGLKSKNGFKLRRDISEKRYVPSYPKEIKIMGEGSILSLSGEKKLSFAVRGLNGIKVKIEKLQNDQINHLISQTHGDISSPLFNNYDFNSQNISNKAFEKVISLAKTHPKDQNYASLDLGKYLKKQGSGIFFISVQDYDTVDGYSKHNIKDKRLIIVTDMGIVAKKAKDSSHDVFVVSIKKGESIANAKVNILGLNGLSIASTTTSSDGKAHFGNLNSYTGAQKPTVIVVTKGQDLAFIPYDQYRRGINYSQFDTGGVYSSSQSMLKELSAYSFSDRGIYRPGESVHLANIVRQGDFNIKNGLVVRAKIYNPKGSLVFKKDYTLDSYGFFTFDFPTKLTSPTGKYNLYIYLPNKKHGYSEENLLSSKSFNVEEFKPDTMKIKVSLEPKKTDGWSSLEELMAKVKLTNLFGLPAQNRLIKADATITPVSFHFKKFNDYRFKPAYIDKKIIRQTTISFDQMKTDKSGQTEFSLNYDSIHSNGNFRLNLNVEGFEADGGRSVRAKSSTLISDAKYMIGIKSDGNLNYLKKGQERNINILAIDKNLTAIELKDISIELVENRTLSVLTKQYDGRYKYQSIIKKVVHNTNKITIPKTSKSIAIDANLGGSFTVNIYSKDKKLLTSFNYFVASKGNTAGELEKNAELKVKLNKTTYKNGEDIEMNILAPYTGTGLITIESNKVNAFKWFKTTTKSSIQTIKLPKDMEGNAYINVTFVRSLDSKEIFTSPLSYTVKAFKINSSKRSLNIELKTPKLIKPGEELKISYKTDKDAKIVVYAVDEGILQVAKYKLPNPLQHFLKKRALEVKTFQMLDLILPEFSSFMELAGVGGGMMQDKMLKALGANLNPFQRTRDKAAVYWSGVVDASQNQKELSFVVPDTFNGSLKVMAVGVSSSAMGSTSTSTKVRGPFVLSANVLNVVAPNDEFDVTLGVSNTVEDSKKELVDISIKLSKNLKLLSKAKITKSIARGDEDKVSFRVKALDTLGEGKITFTAKSKNHKQTRVSTLSIRPAQNFETNIKGAYSKDGATIDSNRNLYKSLASKNISASSSPFVLAGGLTQYLSSYPHGCTEQIVSQVFPSLALVKTSKFKDTNYIENVKKTMQMLHSRIQSDGGFALWPDSRSVNTFASLYAMNFLIEVNLDKSITVDKELFYAGIDYLRKIAREDVTNLKNARLRAMAIYLLTRSQEVTTSYLTDLVEYLNKNQKNWKKDITSTYIASSFKLLKKDKEADELIKAFKPDYSESYTDFQNNFTMRAQYVYLSSLHFPNLELDAKKDILPLIEPVLSGELTSLNASYTLLALSAYSLQNEKKYGKDDLEFYKVGKSDIKLPKSQTKPFMMAKVPLEPTKLSIKSKSPIFYLLTQKGFDKTTHKKAYSNGIEIYKEYYKNSKLAKDVKQGDELEVRLKVRATSKSYISNTVLIDLLPAGFEVIRDSVVRGGYDTWNEDYTDIREDRVIFYAGFANTESILTYNVKVTASGSFTIPSASVASMYNPKILSYTKASHIVVSPSH